MSSRQRRQNSKGATSGRGTSSYDEELNARSRRPRRKTSNFGGPIGAIEGFFSRFSVPKLLTLIFLLVALRLVWLQLIQWGEWQEKASQQQVSDVTILAKRGTIYDRNGNVLATSVDCSQVYCNTLAINYYDKEYGDTENNLKARAEAAQILSDVLGQDVSYYQKVLSEDTTWLVIEDKVDQDIADELDSKLREAKIDGIYFFAETKRVYPYGSLAGQIIGFIGTDGEVRSGLEYYYNDILSGTDGRMVVERGSNGVPIAGGAYEIHEAQDGTDIVISIDINVQRVAEENLVEGVKNAEAESGNVVVTDPSTGEILAACSTPLLDLTDTSNLTNDMLNLTSVTASYEPGSTFKPIMVAIGYDAGVFTRDTVYNVPAEIKVGDDTVDDVDGRDYDMDMTPTEVLKRSSNVGAALLGMQIGADTFAEGIARFGIGSKTGIDFLGESAGIVPERSEYTGASLGSMSFGQSLSFPSIQLVRAIGAIANDGVMTTPHFLVKKAGESVDWGEGTQVVSAEAANMVTEDMVVVVNEDGGTGTNAQISGYEVAGKTGTGEMASASGGYEEGKYLSSFIGFANADTADVLVYVGMYGTAQFGGTAAAPVFQTIMSEALTDLNVEPVS